MSKEVPQEVYGLKGGTKNFDCEACESKKHERRESKEEEKEEHE